QAAHWSRLCPWWRHRQKAHGWIWYYLRYPWESGCHLAWKGQPKNYTRLHQPKLQAEESPVSRSEGLSQARFFSRPRRQLTAVALSHETRSLHYPLMRSRTPLTKAAESLDP